MTMAKTPDPRLRANGRAFAHIAQFHPELTAFRRDLHAHPELGFEEHYTAARVAQALKLCGVDEIHTAIGKTGVVGIVRGRQTGSGRMIGLRADMDALPMTEHNDFAWKSSTAGLMHGCGHDGHTAMLIGAARYLAETRQFRRHGRADLPARRGRLRRRTRDDRGRPVRAFPGRCGVWRCTTHR